MAYDNQFWIKTHPPLRTAALDLFCNVYCIKHHIKPLWTRTVKNTDMFFYVPFLVSKVPQTRSQAQGVKHSWK